MHPTAAFAAPPEPADSWAGLYLHPAMTGEGARRLVSTPFRLQKSVGGLGSVLPVKASPTLTGNHPAVSVPGSPSGQQIPASSISGRTRRALPFCRLHQADATTEACEDVYRHDVKRTAIRHVENREIKIRCFVSIPHHDPSIGLGASSVDGVEPLRALIPGTFDLETNQRAVAINRKVVGKPISYWPQHPESSLEEFRHNGGFRDVGCELGVQ